MPASATGSSVRLQQLRSSSHSWHSERSRSQPLLMGLRASLRRVTLSMPSSASRSSMR